MQAFIQVNLESNGIFSYHRPLLAWFKAQAPEIAVLDIDSKSDEMLVVQACRLIREATEYALYFKVEEPNAEFGSAFKLLEEIIQEDKSGLILLEGTHTRLTAIVQARPHLLLIPVPGQAETKPHLQKYFNLPGYSG